jgi:uncharacterized protein with GYD domain
MLCVYAVVLFASIILMSSLVFSADKKDGTILLTIFMKHDQSKTLGEINAHLDKTGFRNKFPPEGTEVVSWYVMMGIGQVVTLRVPPDKLRAVNVVIEENAWGAYRTEFYATYDYKPIWESTSKKK